MNMKEHLEMVKRIQQDLERQQKTKVIKKKKKEEKKEK
tara:strand:- start:360 stop:473 length:114 start_codon:yes stop_codon:yes gene_type:complete